MRRERPGQAAGRPALRGDPRHRSRRQQFRSLGQGIRSGRRRRGGGQEAGDRMSAMRRSRRGLLLAIGCGVLAAAAPPAPAADFYQGKTLTLIVGYAPGGGVDTTARVVARHLVRFIPGQPSVVVQNMEGAAGIVAVNYLDRRAAPDGLTLG